MEDHRSWLGWGGHADV